MSCVKTVAHSDRPRFFCKFSKADISVGSRVTLDQSNAHHAKGVLRLKLGDLVEIGCPDGSFLLLCKITEFGTDTSLEVLEHLNPRESSETEITLLCALLKGDKNEQLCDWACELGVSRVVIFQSERSIVRLKGQDEIDKKNKKFNARLEAAAKQSHRNLIPKSSIYSDLTQALSALNQESANTYKIYGSLEDKALPLSQAIQANGFNKVILVIGPEGDFSDKEKEQLHSSGVTPVTFGNNVLRSELAAVTGIVAINLLSKV